MKARSSVKARSNVDKKKDQKHNNKTNNYTNNNKKDGAQL